MYRTERAAFIHLLRVASRMEARLNRRASKKNHGHFIRYYHLYFQAIPFVLAIGALISWKYCGASESVRIAGLAILLLLYIATLAHPFIIAWVNRRAVLAAAKEPMNLLLQNANVTATVDGRVLPRLLRKPLDHLELFLLEIKAEKEFFERRISLTIGSIEKIGMGPGLLAAGVSLSNVKSIQSEWVLALAYATPILYLFGVAAHFLLMRLDRYVKLIELAVSRKKSLTSLSSGQPKASLSPVAEVQR